ncbi:uncharacterized protein LOC128999572 [Macrosteles quadrilineatus]|uniref:uncharacterized protein LOC128999572 n=1 Tax=Macrosteles quadrilineatus TaxID=74068 RepID=UPI0023E140A6|nr:uncharacterized protein LOC128999572 [Macrosteles quadrilineatus]
MAAGGRMPMAQYRDGNGIKPLHQYQVVKKEKFTPIPLAAAKNEAQESASERGSEAFHVNGENGGWGAHWRGSQFRAYRVRRRQAEMKGGTKTTIRSENASSDEEKTTLIPSRNDGSIAEIPRHNLCSKQIPTPVLSEVAGTKDSEKTKSQGQESLGEGFQGRGARGKGAQFRRHQRRRGRKPEVCRPRDFTTIGI